MTCPLILRYLLIKDELQTLNKNLWETDNLTLYYIKFYYKLNDDNCWDNGLDLFLIGPVCLAQ